MDSAGAVPGGACDPAARVVCCYRKRPDSVTTKPSLRSLYDEAENTAALLNFYCQGACGKEDEAEKLFRFWLSSFLMLFSSGADIRLRIVRGDRDNKRDSGDAFHMAQSLPRLRSRAETVDGTRIHGGEGRLFFRLADLLFICVYSPLILKLWPLLKKKK
ncbi:MAG: hypothetical protein V8T87_15420 [Victivallales bacterium]